MNTRTNYLPTNDAERMVWFNNFSTKLGGYAPQLGITPLEVTGTHNDCAFYQYIVNMLDSYKQSVNNITSYKNMAKHAMAQQHMGPIPSAPVLPAPPALVPEGIFDRVSKLAQRIKASANYYRKYWPRPWNNCSYQFD